MKRSFGEKRSIIYNGLKVLELQRINRSHFLFTYYLQLVGIAFIMLKFCIVSLNIQKELYENSALNLSEMAFSFQIMSLHYSCALKRALVTLEANASTLIFCVHFWTQINDEIQRGVELLLQRPLKFISYRRWQSSIIWRGCISWQCMWTRTHRYVLNWD